MLQKDLFSSSLNEAPFIGFQKALDSKDVQNPEFELQLGFSMKVINTFKAIKRTTAFKHI